MLSSLSLLAHKLFWIRLDWIVLHTNENTESMVKGRIDPSALPNSRRINPTSVIMCDIIKAFPKYDLKSDEGVDKAIDEIATKLRKVVSFQDSSGC